MTIKPEWGGGVMTITPKEHRRRMRELKAKNRERIKRDRKMSKQAWLQVRCERRAIAEATLGWRQRLDDILRCVAHVRGEDSARKEAWQLFKIRWRP